MQGHTESLGHEIYWRRVVTLCTFLHTYILLRRSASPLGRNKEKFRCKTKGMPSFSSTLSRSQTHACSAQHVLPVACLLERPL